MANHLKEVKLTDEQLKTTSRKLKVYPKYFERSYRPIVFPEIRLCGKWLQELGFVDGQIVKVEGGVKKITISVEIEPIKSNPWD